MRLAIVSVGPPYRGGISDLSALLFHELSREHTVHFINYSRQYPKLLFPGKTEYKVGAQAADLQSERLIDSINPLSWRRAVNRIAELAPDAVIFRYWNPFFALLINFMSKRIASLGIRVLVLVDNLIPHEPSRIDGFMAKKVLQHAHHVFSMSQSVSRDVLSTTGRKEVTTLFHPLYEIYTPQYSKAEARKQLGLGAGPIALFFGLIRPYKGLDILLNALPQVLQKIPDLFTFILGEAYEDETKYRNLIRSNDLTGQVNFRNEFIADADLPLYFAACDTLVLPYRTATQSGIIGIAFQFNRPVIATHVGGLGEYIEPGVSGYLVPPDDPSALAEAMIQFFESDEDLEAKVKQHKQKFSITKFCEALLEDIQRG